MLPEKLINFLPYELNKDLLNSRIHLTLTDAPLYILICEKFCEKLSVGEWGWYKQDENCSDLDVGITPLYSVGRRNVWESYYYFTGKLVIIEIPYA